jgi:hypothetical protein
LYLAIVYASPASLKAVIFDATGDSTFNITAPGGLLAGSGWQYQGTFGDFLGTPIAPQYFITAEHFGGSIGQTFTINSTNYTTTGFTDDPNSDLRIWQISGTFAPAEIAPLYTLNPSGESLVVFGRGTQRGADVNNPGLQGWLWGTNDQVQRWGTNDVEGLANGGAGVGQLLVADFDHFGPTEAMLSVGDSWGAVFVEDAGVWKLAGINYAVSGPYYTDILGNGGFNAALFDESGFFTQISSDPNVYASATGSGLFYSTNISSNLAFINSVIPEPGTAGLALLGMTFLLTVSRRGRQDAP